jgi:hypothetical protein
MTPDGWNHCGTPRKMTPLLWASEKARGRPWGLFTIACSRRIWPSLGRGCHRVVETAERLADGQANRDDLEKAVRASRELPGWAVSLDGWFTMRRAFRAPLPRHTVSAATVLLVAEAAVASPEEAIAQEDEEAWITMLCRTMKRGRRSAERRGQCALLRCVFGTPSQLPALDRSRLGLNDGLVLNFARAAYDDRRLPEGTLDPGRLAVLADALEEGGCVDADVLAHLRSPVPHVRGCHTLDLVLGKS